MKNNLFSGKRRWLLTIAGAAGSCILLLSLLVYAESTDPNASIRTLPDALWYAFVTLSTVGYGDLYPVTAAGKALGVVFILLSTGLLTFLIGAIISVFFNRLLPSARIFSCRNADWYIFYEMNAASAALAENITAEHPDCTLIFLTADAGCTCAPNCKHLVFSGGLLSLLELKGKRGSCHFFCMGNDEAQNSVHIREARGTGHKIYCRTQLEADRAEENVSVFDPYSCCARMYWQQYPLKKDESDLLLIGSGQYARQLLEQGLLTNVRFPGQEISCHVFGDWSDYLRCHPQLGLTIDLSGQNPHRDRVVFSCDPWNTNHDLLVNAHRIILCCDSEAENLALYCQICRCFPISGTIYLRGSCQLNDAVVFGSDRDIYTGELVMQNRLNQAAMTMHDIYRSSSGNGPAWEELSAFLRQSNIAAADHLLTKIRLLTGDDSIVQVTAETCARAYDIYRSSKAHSAQRYRQTEHLRWMRFHSLYNWRYAPVRCNPRREHPMLVPFDALSEPEQRKDDYAWEMLDILSQRLS